MIRFRDWAINSIRYPPPRQGPYRLVSTLIPVDPNLSIEVECLDHVAFLSEAHLRHHVEAYILHYNTERPHQGIGNVPIGTWTVGTGEIVCDESLGGLLKSFRRAA